MWEMKTIRRRNESWKNIEVCFQLKRKKKMKIIISKLVRAYSTNIFNFFCTALKNQFRTGEIDFHNVLSKKGINFRGLLFNLYEILFLEKSKSDRSAKIQIQSH